MAIFKQVEEKPGGARNVVKWDVRTVRDYRPLYFLDRTRAGYDPDGGQFVTVNIGVEFEDDESAQDFEAKVRALLPEMKP
jgi:hypothetical protein